MKGGVTDKFEQTIYAITITFDVKVLKFLLFGFIWLLFAFRMQKPRYLSTLIFEAQCQQQDQALLSQKLAAMPGVDEVAFMAGEDLIYVKADKQIVSKDELRKVVESVTLAG